MLLVTLALLFAHPVGMGPSMCVVEGTVRHLDRVTVLDLERRAPLFEAMLHDARVQASIGAGDETILQGSGGLLFRARTARTSLPLRVKRTTTIAGVLTLSPKTPLVVERVDGGELEVVAQPTEGVTLGPFRVKCEALTLGDAAPDDDTSVRSPPAKSRLVTTARTFEVAGKHGAVSVSLAEDSPLIVDGVVRDAPQSSIRARWSDGTELRGNVPSTILRSSPDAVEPALGHIGGMCGFGVSHAYHGPATMKVGARIVDKAVDGTAWAEAVKPTRIEVIGNFERVEVTSVPGVVQSAGCVRTERAWADASTLTYPGPRR